MFGSVWFLNETGKPPKMNNDVVDVYKNVQSLRGELDSLKSCVAVTQDFSTSSAKTAIGLDFGLNCGFAYAIYSETHKKWYMFPQMISVVDLNTTRYESKSTCFLLIRQLLHLVNPSVIFYEDVKFTPQSNYSSNAGAIVARVSTSIELLSSLRAVALMWAEDNNVPFIGISIQTIKKTATGSGKANKQQVIEACNKMFGTNLSESGAGHDNAADAAFVLYSGLINNMFGNLQ